MQWLFDNPFLFFIIIAGILSFFRRMGGEGQEEKKPGTPAPRRNTNQEEVDWRDIFRQEQTPLEEQEQRSRQTPSRSAVDEVYRAPNDGEKELDRASQQLQDRYDKVQKRKELASRKARGLEGSPILNDQIESKSGVRLNFNNISREEIIKGVVWAEILGSPKARKSR